MNKEPEKIIEDVEGVEIRRLSALWRCVVAQAVRDMASEDAEIAYEAVRWIGSADMEDTADWAGLDPVWLENKIYECLAKPNPYRRHSLINLSRAINHSMLSGL